MSHVSVVRNIIDENGGGSHLTHALLLSRTLKLFNDNTNILLLDADAFPLSQQAIKHVFADIDRFDLVGNIQRTNCVENDKHLFVAPSFAGFNLGRIRQICGGELSSGINPDHKNDVFEKMVDLVTRSGGAVQYYRPMTCKRPIWCLESGLPEYGIATAFGVESMIISYHHFCSRIYSARLGFYFYTKLVYLRIKLSSIVSGPLGGTLICKPCSVGEIVSSIQGTIKIIYLSTLQELRYLAGRHR
jgi:hypothetical protein